MRKLRQRLTFANVVSVIALVSALGLGTAWAATELEKNDVTSKIIKNGGVKTKDLGNNAVTSPKVANGSLLEEDFGAGQLPTGPQGLPGTDGEDATNLFAYIRDNGDGVAASVAYGKGVTGVSETAFAGEYRVTFEQSVSNCVAHATSGEGDPHVGAASTDQGAAAIYMQTDAAEVIEVVFQDAAGVDGDTSFLVSAFC
jgi:hypothetical protein